MLSTQDIKKSNAEDSNSQVTLSTEESKNAIYSRYQVVK